MTPGELQAIVAKIGRGGAHRRSRADEESLARAVAELLNAEPRASLRELWLHRGFGDSDLERLGAAREALFSADEAIERQRRPKLQALRAAKADVRMRAADWWIRQGHAPSSRRSETLLCDPAVTEAMLAALERERDPRAREALAGALSLVVGRHFPDRRAETRLLRLATDSRSGIRFFAVQGLVGLLASGGSAAVSAALVERGKDGAPGVRTALATALDDAERAGRIAPSVGAPIREALGALGAPR